MALKHRSNSSTADVSAVTITTHVLHVDLRAQLAGIDLTDNVVLMIATPSGREKRVALGGNFLVEPHAVRDEWAL